MIVTPLTALLKRRAAHLLWNLEAESAFSQLKEAFTPTPLVLLLWMLGLSEEVRSSGHKLMPTAATKKNIH